MKSSFCDAHFVALFGWVAEFTPV